MATTILVIVVVVEMRLNIDWPIRRSRAGPRVWSVLMSTSTRG